MTGHGGGIPSGMGGRAKRPSYTLFYVGGAERCSVAAALEKAERARWETRHGPAKTGTANLSWRTSSIPKGTSRASHGSAISSTVRAQGVRFSAGRTSPRSGPGPCRCGSDCSTGLRAFYGPPLPQHADYCEMIVSVMRKCEKQPNCESAPF